MTRQFSTNSRGWAGMDRPKPIPREHWYLNQRKGEVILTVKKMPHIETIAWPASIKYDATMRRTMRGALHLLREKIKLAENVLANRHHSGAQSI